MEWVRPVDATSCAGTGSQCRLPDGGGRDPRTDRAAAERAGSIWTTSLATIASLLVRLPRADEQAFEPVAEEDLSALVEQIGWGLPSGCASRRRLDRCHRAGGCPPGLWVSRSCLDQLTLTSLGERPAITAFRMEHDRLGSR